MDGGSRRLVWLLLVMAVVLGFVLGWLTRVWMSPSPESGARGAVEKLQQRVRELTR
jgi:H+/Cl- antiporter ClcA